MSADPSFLLRYAWSTAACRDYPLAAKLRHLKAMRRAMDRMWTDLGHTDFMRDAAKLDVPVHVCRSR